MTTLVLGGGLAGVAAAWALESRGREVILAWEGVGASALYSGALDREDWDATPDARPVARDVEDFLHALGCWAPPGLVSARLATSAGVIRPARCRDRALLDLEPLRGRRIDVVDFGRADWDAAELARAWSASAWARQSRTEFRPLEVALPAHFPEPEALRFLPPLELAARADDPVWSSELAEALHVAGDREAPLLFGPWLGLSPATLERIREVARRPIGETLSEPGGSAGARFEAAREAWLGRSGVRVVRGLATSLQHEGEGDAGGFEVFGHWETLPGSIAEAVPRPGRVPRGLDRRFREVILAIGGIAGGGIRFLWGGGAEARSFSLSLEAPVPLRLRGREASLQSGASGADLQSLGRDALERVGLSVDAEQQTPAPGLFAAGDVVADRPRTALEAISAGISAARSVCRVRAPS